MGHDSLSPFAPARIRCLVVPYGRISRSRFLDCVKRLKQEAIVRLSDVSPSKNSDDGEFAPQTFPTGCVLYDFSTSRSLSSQRVLIPFEIFREDFVVLAVADGQDQDDQSEEDSEREAERVNGYIACVAALQDDFPSALVHRLLLFDYEKPNRQLPQAIMALPSTSKGNRTVLKATLAEITGSLLTEFAAYTKSVRALPNVDTPKTRVAQEYFVDGSLHRSSQLSSRTSLHQSNGSDQQLSDLSNSSNRTSMPPHLTTMASEPTLEKRPVSGILTSTETSRPTSVSNGSNTAIERTASSTVIETQSQTNSDRVSMHGFGSGSIGERAREQAQSHISVVVGSIYLLAGKWRDAVNELVSGATVAKGNSDYVWLAKALDLLLVSLLMLAWAEVEFDIPPIMYPSGEKAASSKHGRSKSISRSGINTNGSSAEPHQMSLQNLHNVLRDLAYNIPYFYSRAAEINAIRVPQVIFSEATIRLARLLIITESCEDILEKSDLDFLITQTEQRPRQASGKPLLPASGKGEIATFLYRAIPSSTSQDSMQVVDRLHLLTGVARLLSDLGYHRKKAFILREVVALLLPALVQSRKDSAAEEGFHPAASMSSLDLSLSADPVSGSAPFQGSNDNIQSILTLICEVYGIVSPGTQPESSASGSLSGDQDTDFVALRAFDTANRREFGNIVLKSDVLRTCLNVCEALPDLRGVLRFSSDLLCTAGSGVAPGPDTVDASPAIPADDQIRLASNISRAASAAQQAGQVEATAEYWDEFLVRDIVFDRQETPSSLPVLRHKDDFHVSTAAKEGPKHGPFIFDPFAAKSGTVSGDNVLVVNEGSNILLLLQNLYDIDLEIEWIELNCKDPEMVSIAKNIVVGPYRTQRVHMVCTPKSAGELVVSSCLAKIRGCRARMFPLFKSPWRMHNLRKMKRIGLAGTEVGQPRVAVDSSTSESIHTSLLPRPSTFEATVIEAQPTLVLKAMSFAQSALMVLDGERRSFTAVLRNVSDIFIDFAAVSLFDNTLEYLKVLTEDKDIVPAAVYEEEVRAYRHPSLSRAGVVGGWIGLEPHSELTLQLEAFGKLGLNHGTIIVDYCHLGVPRAEAPDRFFTRQLSVDFNVTVSSSLGLVHNDVFAVTEDLPRVLEQLKLDHNLESTKSALWHLLQNNDRSSTDYCVLLLDLHNAWSEPLSVVVELSDFAQTSEKPDLEPLTIIIEPGSSSRVLLPIRRLLLPNAHAPIPSLNPKNKRQYVVSSSGNVDPELERTARELFWYREEILSTISAKWSVHGKRGRSRKGEVDLRRFILTARMLEALRKSDVEVSLSLIALDKVTSKNPEPSRVKSVAETSQFVTLLAKVQSRLPYPFQPHLRILPALRNQAYNIALDLGRKVAFNGVLQRTLPTLKPGEEIEVKFGMTFLASGDYEIGAVVEELRVPGSKGTSEEEKAGVTKRRARAATGDFDLDVLAERTTRRAWYARESYAVKVNDRPAAAT